MPNTWTYTLVFKEQAISDEVFQATIEAVNASGYSVWTPKTFCEIEAEPSDLMDALFAASFFGPRRIRGMSRDGMKALEFKSLEAAKQTLLAQGGLITLWKEVEGGWHREISMSVRTKQRELALAVGYDLRKDRKEDIRTALDLNSLFRDLCKVLRPMYGYSTDEWRLEAALAGRDFMKEWEAFEQEMSNFEPPRFLFWLNYFSSSYLESIGDLGLDCVPHSREIVSEGTFVYLAEHPWEAPIAVITPDGRYRCV